MRCSPSAIAQQIVDEQGYYLMIVKANQPQLRDDLALFFELSTIAADQELFQFTCLLGLRFEKCQYAELQFHVVLPGGS